MASELDKALKLYRERPRDQSGARKNKISLIFDPKTAAYTDADTFYQIGLQGYNNLLSRDNRYGKFHKSVFDYSNINIDPLSLSDDKYKSLNEKVRKVIYLTSEYLMDTDGVRILEFLIQQFAASILNPQDLLLVSLPCCETNIFVRICQTIPFKSLKGDSRVLKAFEFVLKSKEPINRRILIEIIQDRPTLLNWILSGMNNISQYHPSGMFSSFVGVLLSELSLINNNDVIISNIYNELIKTIESDSHVNLVQLLMAFVTINETKNVESELSSARILKTINKHAQTIFNKYYKQMCQAILYLFQKSSPVKIKPEFVINFSKNVSEIKSIIKESDTKNISISFMNCITKSSQNVELLKYSLLLFETQFFEPVAHDLMINFVNNYPGGEYADLFINRLANEYPDILVQDVNELISEKNISVTLQAHTRQGIVDSLSETSKAAALYSDPTLDFELASTQAVNSLIAAETADSTELLEPLFSYFSGRYPESVIKFIFERIFILENKFSVGLNNIVRKYIHQVFPAFKDLPTNNKDILFHLSKHHDQLPDYPIFSISIAKAHALGDVKILFNYIPRNMTLNYEEIHNGMTKILENHLQFEITSTESRVSLILAIIYTIYQTHQLSISDLPILFGIKHLKCILPILKLVIDQGRISDILASYELLSQKQITAANNYIVFMHLVSDKVNVFELIPLILISFREKFLQEKAFSLFKAIGPKIPEEDKTIYTEILKQHDHLVIDDSTSCHTLNIIARRKGSFFEKCWANLHTIEGCEKFWFLVESKNAEIAIKNLYKLSGVYTIASLYFKKFSDNTDLINFCVNSMSSELLCAVMPYLDNSYLNKLIYFPCTYPQYYAKSFQSYFENNKFLWSDLQNLLLMTAKIDPKPQQPPQFFKANSFDDLAKKLMKKSVISPAVIILECIPLSQNAFIENESKLVEAYFKLLQSDDSKKVLPYIFPCLLRIVEESAEYMVQNFDVIISAITNTTTAIIHLSALEVVKLLSQKYPAEVALHCESIFRILSNETLYNDDVSNLTRIKDLLSKILIPLADAGQVSSLLNFFSVNIRNFSISRASHLLIHCIKVLDGNSWRVFQSLLNNNQTDFASKISDQIDSETLISSLIDFINNTDQSTIAIEFFNSITFPPIPTKLNHFFSVLFDKYDENQFELVVTNIMNSFSLRDFILISEESITKENISLLFLNLLMNRINDEPSETYSQLLLPLEKLIKSKTNLLETFNCLNLMIPIVSQSSYSDVEKVISTSLQEAMTSDEYRISIQQQILSFCAKSVERFVHSNPRFIQELYPSILEYSAYLLQYIITNEVNELYKPATGSVCLILQSALEFAADSLKDLVPLLLSPVLLFDDELKDNLILPQLFAVAKSIPISILYEPLMIIVTESSKQLNKTSVTLVSAFDLLKVSIENSDVHSIRGTIAQNLKKCFLISFSIRFSEWNDNDAYQNSVAYSTTSFVTKLNSQVFGSVYNEFCSFLSKLSEKNHQEDYLLSRLLFMRVELSIAKELKLVFVKYYSSFINYLIDFCYENDDSDIIQQQITINCMEILSLILPMAPESFIDTYFIKFVEIIKLHYKLFDGENTQEDIDDLIKEQARYTYEFKTTAVAYAFAALLNSAKDKSHQLAEVINELLRNSNSKVRIAALNTLPISYSEARDVFIGIVADIIPTLNECRESNDRDSNVFANAIIKDLSDIDIVQSSFDID